MDAAAQAVVGAGHDVFLADEFGERDNAIGYQFRVLDDVGGVADNARKDLPGGEANSRKCGVALRRRMK